MNFRNITKVTIASAILLAPISSAFAYSIHFIDGKYSVTCDNGYKWTRGDGTQQITHDDAARICAKQGSSIVMPNDQKPGTTKKSTLGVIQQK